MAWEKSQRLQALPPYLFLEIDRAKREALAAGRAVYAPDLAAQKETLLSHFDRACELYGPVRGPKTMRKFGIRYARLHPHPRDVRMAFVEVKTPGDWHAVVERLYA